MYSSILIPIYAYRWNSRKIILPNLVLLYGFAPRRVLVAVLVVKQELGAPTLRRARTHCLILAPGNAQPVFLLDAHDAALCDRLS